MRENHSVRVRVTQLKKESLSKRESLRERDSLSERESLSDKESLSESGSHSVRERVNILWMYKCMDI